MWGMCKGEEQGGKRNGGGGGGAGGTGGTLGVACDIRVGRSAFLACHQCWIWN